MQGCSVQPFDGGSEAARSHVTDGTQVNELRKGRKKTYHLNYSHEEGRVLGLLGKSIRRGSDIVYDGVGERRNVLAAEVRTKNNVLVDLRAGE